MFRALLTDGMAVARIGAILSAGGFSLLKAIGAYAVLEKISYAWGLLPVVLWLLYAYYVRWDKYNDLAEQVNSDPKPDTQIHELFEYVQQYAAFWSPDNTSEEAISAELTRLERDFIDKAAQGRLLIWGRREKKSLGETKPKPLVLIDVNDFDIFSLTFLFLEEKYRENNCHHVNTYKGPQSEKLFDLWVDQRQMKSLWPQKEKQLWWKFVGSHGTR